MCNNKKNCHCDADILKSIALEEAGLAHILNAEGEKIQKAVASDVSIDDLLSVNRSVTQTIKEVTLLEIVLLNKLDRACNIGCCPRPPKPEKQGKICVKVMCCESRKPIENAQVTILCQCKPVDCGFTGCEGTFESQLLCIGQYAVIVLHDGKQAESFAVVECGECTPVEFCFPCSCPPPPPPPPPPPVVIRCRRGTVQGRVSDVQGCALLDACVTVVSCNETHSVMTDCDGCYSFCNIQLGKKINIKVKCGCRVVSRCIMNHAQKNLRVDFKLSE